MRSGGGRPWPRIAALGTRYTAIVLLSVTSGCAFVPSIELPWGTTRPRVFRGPQTNSGPERYSSWFGDSDGTVLYFGLSPFFETSWECEAAQGRYCALSDLKQPGDHLIGRFDLDREKFLAPLLVRASDPLAPSSVWDVLVHSNGRLYYTTFWDEFGSLLPDGTDVRHYAGVGTGLNELWEGPGGEIYATRYLGSFVGADDENGAIVVFGPDGVRRREFPFKKEEGVLICPKSVAVDPLSSDIWVNSDLFDADGNSQGYNTFRLSPDGQIRERISTPQVSFLSFDPSGRGWFVDDVAGRFVLRIVDTNGQTTRFDLGEHGPIDVAQEIKHFGDITLIATWALKVHVVRALGDGRYEYFALPRVDPPGGCPRDAGPLGYTAVLSSRGVVYQSVSCGIMVVRHGALDP